MFSFFLLLLIGSREWVLQISLAELIARGVQFESHMHAICPHLCLPDLHNSSSIHQSMKGESIFRGNHLVEHTLNAIAGFYSTTGPAFHHRMPQKIDPNYQPSLPPNEDVILIATFLTSHISSVSIQKSVGLQQPSLLTFNS